jgi:hypothetical protein
MEGRQSWVDAKVEVERHLAMGEWEDALKCSMNALRNAPNEEALETLPAKLALRRLTRVFAELNFALPDDYKWKQSPAAVQNLCFSRVAAQNWLPSQGIAAVLLNRSSTALGDVVRDEEHKEKLPMLVAHDDWCAVCSQKGSGQRCSGCKNVFYCSPEHQKADWRRHRLACIASQNPWWNSTEKWRERMAQIERRVMETLAPQEKNE